MSILGNRVVRSEDPRLLTGASTYVEDVDVPGAARATFVRSLMAHARITGIDTSALTGISGAQVFTADDVDLPPVVPSLPGVNAEMTRPLIAKEVVRHVGEIVAVVVTDGRARGADAAELVVVDYDPLPVVVEPQEALRGQTLLFPEQETNVCAQWLPDESDERLFEGCEVVASGRLVSQRIASCPMEPRAAAALWEGDRLTAWLSTQIPHGARDGLAKMFELGSELVRVIAPDVGGGFGPKGTLALEDVLVAWLARRLGRPVRWAETRSENMLVHGHGRGQEMEVELGGTRDGRLLAYRLRVLQDAGAYPDIGAFLPYLTKLMASGVYAIPRIEFEARSVVTNTMPTTAYRGAGRPEAAQAIERAIDLFAAEAGLDPAEVRRKNLIPPDAFPYTTATGAEYDSGDYERALDLLLESAGYDALRAEQRRRREEGATHQLGIGFSLYVEVTNPFAQTEFGAIEITPEGTARVLTGLSPHGQGHETSLAMIVSDRLGIPFESVEVVHGDTDSVPRGTGTFGSRSLQAGGSAAAEAAALVLENARRLTAELLEANPADVVIDPERGRFHVAGAPEPSRSWTELAAELAERGRLAELAAETDFEPASPTWPFGAHLAVVEVDVETGKVELIRFVSVDDAGRILNPLIVQGQRHGGIAQGAAQALLEEFVYDADGSPLTGSFLGYEIVSAAELPSFELVPMETPTSVNELGAKGIGESGTIGATPAVQNAVVDALAHLGVRHVDMPLSGERVWRALQEAGA